MLERTIGWMSEAGISTTPRAALAQSSWGERFDRNVSR